MGAFVSKVFFQIFVVKLVHFIINEFPLYVCNKYAKTENSSFAKKKSFFSIGYRSQINQTFTHVNANLSVRILQSG